MPLRMQLAIITLDFINKIRKPFINGKIINKLNNRILLEEFQYLDLNCLKMDYKLFRLTFLKILGAPREEGPSIPNCYKFLP